MNNEELRKEKLLAFREKAKQAMQKPPPSKRHLHHLIKQDEVAGEDDFDDEEEYIIFYRDYSFDDDVLSSYVTEHNCTEEVKSVMKMNLPRKDIVFLWFVAIEYGIDYVVVEMVRSGFSTNECYFDNFENSFTALMHVVINCFDGDNDDDIDDMWMDSLRFVLGLGVDVNFKEHQTEMSALLVACQHSCVPAVKLLLEHGADPEVRDDRGRNVLVCACSWKKIDVVKFWIERNIDVNEQDNGGSTALIHAIDNSSDINDEDNFVVAQLLWEHGADVNISNNNGKTAFMAAIEYKRGLGLLKLLLNHGADINAQNKRGQTALMLATICANRYGNLLLQHGANADIQDNDGNTAIMYACGRGFTEMVELLLNHGADKDVTNKNGKTALDFAKTSKVKKMLRNHVDTTYVLK